MSAEDGKPRRRKLSEEERDLWGRITRSIAPLRRKPILADPAETAATPSKPKPAPSARPHAAAVGATPNPVPRLQPLDRRQKQRLARGTESIDARIDLHGKTQGEAHVALLRFLRGAQTDGAKFVLVITGKGARATDIWSERGVLKRQVPLWLRLPEFHRYVVGFEQAHVGHGGEGALYVRVRRPRPG
jgi:DNA-nicking Smr family endonuclease